jgi:hypothetical protein
LRQNYWRFCEWVYRHRKEDLPTHKFSRHLFEYEPVLNTSICEATRIPHTLDIVEAYIKAEYLSFIVRNNLCVETYKLCDHDVVIIIVAIAPASIHCWPSPAYRSGIKRNVLTYHV